MMYGVPCRTSVVWCMCTIEVSFRLIVSCVTETFWVSCNMRSRMLLQAHWDKLLGSSFDDWREHVDHCYQSSEFWLVRNLSGRLGHPTLAVLDTGFDFTGMWAHTLHGMVSSVFRVRRYAQYHEMHRVASQDSSVKVERMQMGM